jgi:sugar transferase EpsL
MKRLFNILLIGFFSPLILPMLFFLYLLVWINIGFPLFFKQVRPGLNGNLFIMYKFKTMTNECDKNGILEPDSVRLTRFGEFLRSTSLDELPGLWNVLKGDMNLVGPRPLLVEYLPLYSERQSRRHEVRPGITGWAQINGRNAISWDKKFDLDVWYVDNQSFWLDIKILWMTVKKVIMRDGISQNNHVTMDKFKGSL